MALPLFAPTNGISADGFPAFHSVTVGHPRSGLTVQQCLAGSSQRVVPRSHLRGPSAFRGVGLGSPFEVRHLPGETPQKVRRVPAPALPSCETLAPAAVAIDALQLRRGDTDAVPIHRNPRRRTQFTSTSETTSTRRSLTSRRSPDSLPSVQRTRPADCPPTFQSPRTDANGSDEDRCSAPRRNSGVYLRTICAMRFLSFQ